MMGRRVYAHVMDSKTYSLATPKYQQHKRRPDEVAHLPRESIGIPCAHLSITN